MKILRVLTKHIVTKVMRTYSKSAKAFLTQNIKLGCYSFKPHQIQNEDIFQNRETWQDKSLVTFDDKL